MRRFIIVLGILAILIMTLLALTGTGLAFFSPLAPGSTFFPLQEMIEFQRASLIRQYHERVDYQLGLVDKRIQDLDSVIGSQDEFTALTALEHALDEVIDSMSQVPDNDLAQLKTQLAESLTEIDTVLKRLVILPSDSPDLYENFQVKINTLFAMVSKETPVLATSADTNVDTSIVEATPITTTPDASELEAVNPQAITFPPGSEGAQHKFFPLTGKHAEISCQNCHANGQYAGTPNLCINCHEEEKPEVHYEFDCSYCHFSTVWEEVNFEHPMSIAFNCEGCHLSSKPAVHYPGLCTTCHNTTVWSPSIFDHTINLVTDCRSCHTFQAPVNHYNGQCSGCHTTRAWRPANFDHQLAGATNCQLCHSDNRPANHFGGQCSTCHNTRNWRDAKLDHKAAGATDCQSCHSSQRPAGHFSGQCSACHNTSNWGNATFNHSAAGATDCQSCHSSPGDHWPGQCSNCHSTNGWGNVKISGHKFPMDHGDAGGNCSACHDGYKTSVNCYTCHNRSETEKKHAEEDIFDIAGRCLQCHPTGDEGDD